MPFSSHRSDNLAKAKQMSQSIGACLTTRVALVALSIQHAGCTPHPRPRVGRGLYRPKNREPRSRKFLQLKPFAGPSVAFLEFVRAAAFLVWAVARQGCDLSRILAVSRAILLAICADTGAGFVGALSRWASHCLNLQTKQRENSSTIRVHALSESWQGMYEGL